MVYRPPLLEPSIKYSRQRRRPDEERVVVPLADHPFTACVEPLKNKGSYTVQLGGIVLFRLLPSIILIRAGVYAATKKKQSATSEGRVALAMRAE